MEGVIGYLTIFAGNFAPKNWALCQGQIINIASNTAAFSILGTTYGGNGTTTFGLPNLQGKTVIGAGSGPGLSSYSLGQNGGIESLTLNTSQMPAHSHPVAVTSTFAAGAEATTNVATNNVFGADKTGDIIPFTVNPDTQLKPYSGTINTAPNGGNQPISISNPYLSLNYIICLYGVYPARN